MTTRTKSVLLPKKSENKTESSPPSAETTETMDWEQLNARRVQLIHKNVEQTISPEEKRELERLQQLVSEKVRQVAPLPLKELEAFQEELKRRGLWKPS